MGDDREEGVARRGTVLAAHPSAELYGSDRMFLESVAGLGEAGWDVVVALPQPGPLVGLLEAAGAEVVLVPSPVLRKSALSPKGLLGLAREGLAGVRRGAPLVRRADVVYISTVTVPVWIGLAALLRRPSLVHVHEAEGSASALLRAGMALPLELASSVVVNSRFARDVLARSSRRSGRRATVLPNGVAGPATATDPRPQLTGAVRVLYVGRLSPRKGVDVAVDAVAELVARGHDVHLDLLGAVYPGYEWYEEQLRRSVSENGLGDRVTFHGFRPDVWQVAASSDLVVVPSRADEPFGNTAVEAVLARRPVVVSDTSGLREAAAGYASAQAVTPGDPQALADAVERVVGDWPTFRDGAVADALVAGERHSLAGYRAGVVDRIRRLAPSVSASALTTSTTPTTSATPPVDPPPASVVVAVLTYRRPAELAALLPELAAQARACALPASVLVVDNDPDEAGREVVAASGLPGVVYVHEPRPGIAAGRNAALAAAEADLLVFIDDDEVPVPGWLDLMVAAHAAAGSTAVVGPVVSRFRGEPSPWVAAGRFFDRRRLATGTPVDVAATNNLLLDLRRVRTTGLTFDERFGLSGGSDTLFTRQLVRDGGTIVWCDEALVHDEVPVDRLTTGWVLRRALRSGNSWSRTSVELTDGPAQLARVRLSLAASGAVRLLGGMAQLGAGVARRDMGARARGARTVARGGGMVSGAVGWVYTEYRRPPRPAGADRASASVPT